MKRFDNTRTFLFKTIVLNNRLKTYRKYIDYAKQQGYKICSLSEFYENKDESLNHFILRHDVDYFEKATKKMFEVEKELGVHSTYYFRWSTIDENLIQDMLNAGFDIGLHYETVATYIRENNIQNKEDINISVVQSQLKDEIKEFKTKYNPNMSSCCSHGASENIQLGISSNSILENVNYDEYGIIFEAYDERMYSDYGIYHIMDQNIRNNFGFAYSSNPIDGINEERKNILFLAHPTHWFSSLKLYLINIRETILGRVQYSTTREFKRIAK